MKVASHESHDDPRRRMPRHETDVVTCPLGDIMDLSGTGMRVGFKGRCAVKVGQTVPVKLKTPHGSVAVAARAIWRRRTGLLGGCQIGFHFDGLKPNQVVALATIARFGFIAPDGVQTAGKDAGNEANHGSQVGSPAMVEANIVMAEYYEQLGLPTDATPQDVKNAYRKLARQYHPDVAPGEDNQRKFVELRQAYDLLNDHLRRAG
ncbi:MAG: DnaJ domain-containing protein [Planctomycetota bacterium]